MINSGVDPVTNTTVIPKSVFEMTTTSHTFIDGRSKYPEMSAAGYGMGWMRVSYQGHEVCVILASYAWLIYEHHQHLQIITHSGGIPGISTEVFFLPWDKLGIVALANADVKHIYELTVIYRIIEDYFGLERKYSSRLLDQAAEKTQSLGSHAHNHGPEIRSSPPLPLDAYAGTYHDLGYPSITLCAPTSLSPECKLTLKQFSLFENVTEHRGLYAIVPSMWVSHARIRHKEGNIFSLSGTYLFPHGYGKDTSPFETWEGDSAEATLEFVVQETEDEEAKVAGVGLRGLVGERTNRERIGGTIEEIAEVYWVKA